EDDRLASAWRRTGPYALARKRPARAICELVHENVITRHERRRHGATRDVEVLDRAAQLGEQEQAGRNGERNLPAHSCLGNPTARPCTAESRTKPQKRESWLLSRLSPSTNTLPSGTRTGSAQPKRTMELQPWL